MKKTSQLTPKIIYGILGLAVLIGLYFLFAPQVVEVDTGHVVRKDFEEVLRVDGTIKSKTKVTIVARTTGDIDQINLEVGDILKKGDLITRLKWDFYEPIKSSMNGVISKVHRKSAGPVNRGEPLIDIIDPENLQIEAEVLTTDAVRIPATAKVKITGVGTDNQLQGVVVKISRAGFLKLSALGIEEEKTLVYVESDELKKYQFGDIFHVELEIAISRDRNVLTVPLGALFKNANSWAVYTIGKNKAILRNIEISGKNETEALVTKGLKEGEPVILFPGDRIVEGARIRMIKK